MNYDLIEELKKAHLILEEKELEKEYNEDENDFNYIPPEFRIKNKILFQYNYIKEYFKYRLSTFALSYKANRPILLDLRYNIRVEYNINYDAKNYELVINPIMNYNKIDEKVELIYFKWNIKNGLLHTYIFGSDNDLCIEKANFKKELVLKEMSSKFFDPYTVRYLNKMEIINDFTNIDKVENKIPSNLKPIVELKSIVRYFERIDGNYYISDKWLSFNMISRTGDKNWNEVVELPENCYHCDYHFSNLEALGVYKPTNDFILPNTKEKILTNIKK